MFLHISLMLHSFRLHIETTEANSVANGKAHHASFTDALACNAIRPYSLKLYEGLDPHHNHTRNSVMCLTLLIDRSKANPDNTWFQDKMFFYYQLAPDSNLFCNILWPHMIDVIECKGLDEEGTPIYVRDTPLRHIRLVPMSNDRIHFICLKPDPTLQLFMRSKPTKSAAKLDTALIAAK